jgi:glycine reductase
MTIKVVHYINQYFAGVGGEEKADIKPEVREGPVGPAVGLQKELGLDAEIVATVFCGDSYMAVEGGTGAVDEVIALIQPFQPDVFVGGPTFGSGRYGLATGKVCVAVQERLKIPAVAGMFQDSPGAEEFRKDVVIVPTKESAAGMGAALKELARMTLKLGRGEALGTPEEDGYVPRGIRRNEFDKDRGATRAVNMLLGKMKGSFTTEWPLPNYDRVDAPAALATTQGLKVALVTEGGVVPTGNPDRIPSGWATTWAKYDLSGIQDLVGPDFETVHGGFDTTVGNEDPDRIIPVDVMRDMEKEGKLSLHNYLYSTVGNMGSITEMRRLGVEIAAELRAAGVEAVIVGGT